MKPLFDYDDIVKVRDNADLDQRPNAKAWIVGIFETRPGEYFNKFPEGIIYSIEFEDGSSIEIHEASLQPYKE
jgi:hypothetical protein